MFCQTCGAKLPDGAAFCPVCGSAAGKPPKPAMPPKKKTGPLITLIVLVAAILVASVALVFVLLSRDGGSRAEETEGFTEPEDVLELYVGAALAMDAKSVVECLPEAVVRARADEKNISVRSAREEMAAELQSALDSLRDEYASFDPGKVENVSVEIRDQDKWTSKEIRDFNESFRDTNDIAIGLNEAMTVEVKISGRYDGDTFKFRVNGITLVRTGGFWSVLEENCQALIAALHAEIN